MLGPAIRAWERRQAARDLRVRVHPFAWGLEYLGLSSEVDDPRRTLTEHARTALADSGRFYPDPGAPVAVRHLAGDVVAFDSALTAPESETGRARIRLFSPSRPTRRAIVVLPQWNADRGSHVGVCRWLARRGILAARLTLPYHEERRPPGEPRGDLAVSANLGRTLFAVRQAVSDARRARAWLASEGYERIGILGTSWGSCVAFLALAHEPRFAAAVLHHVSSRFDRVVWRGISTRHVRGELARQIAPDELERFWAPISPIHFIDRLSPTAEPLLLVGRYDLTFPYDLSRAFADAFRRHDKSHRLRVLPWGHYTSAFPPFSAYLLWRVLAYLDERL